MRVGFIQFDVKHNKEENFKTIEQSLSQMDCELVVLPELSLCGYLFEDKEELKKSAESISVSTSVEAMKSLSKKYSCAIIFGLAEFEEMGDKIYNTAVVVDDGKYIGKYRKIHLSDFEKKLFSSGDSNEVFKVRGIKIGVQICFDLWFPEISREQIRKGADLLCAIGNFGADTTYNISHTRAIENLTPLILCNRVGAESINGIDADFLGKSSVLDQRGTELIKGEAEVEIAKTCVVSLGKEKSNVICKDFDSEIAFHY